MKDQGVIVGRLHAQTVRFCLSIVDGFRILNGEQIIRIAAPGCRIKGAGDGIQEIRSRHGCTVGPQCILAQMEGPFRRILIYLIALGRPVIDLSLFIKGQQLIQRAH